MLVINFTHPLTDEHCSEIERLTGRYIDRVLNFPCLFDDNQPFAEQAAQLVDSVGLTGEQWQQEAIVVHLPSHNVIAAAVIADLHGRMGHFPTVIRLRRVPDAYPARFEVAEVINLQEVRDRARNRRVP